MVTIKGAMRSYGAAVRRMEREEQRQAREYARRFKEQQKLLEIENAEQAVLDWENYVEALQSVHKNCTKPIDWNQIKNTKEPKSPSPGSKNQDAANRKLQNYKPSFFDKFFGSDKKKNKNLNRLLEKAKMDDLKEFETKQTEFSEELQNWITLQEISAGIENRSEESYKDTLQYFDPFSDIGELGTKVNIQFFKNHLDIDLHVNSLDIIPEYELKQTSTGKLSKRNMSKTRFNEMYQDHVCSCILRVAREVFAYLPIEHVRINAVAKLVNSKTGHLEEQPILSVIIPPATIESLNLETIDPSDSMQNFVHNMKFRKTSGFEVVETVELKQ